MFRKMAVTVVLMAGCAVTFACAGNATGTSEGDSCSSVDECNSELQCQPVAGHSGSYCCPAPLKLPDGTFTSDKSNCQPSGH
jgi:hypothetical protein